MTSRIEESMYQPMRSFEEPWVKLPTNSDFADWTHEDEVKTNQVNRQIEKYKFYTKTFDFLNENKIEGDYHEFGCHRARTFRMALSEARRHGLKDMRFYAYDSFEGLPVPTSGPSPTAWTGGSLATSEENFMQIINSHGIYTNNVKTIKGFYNKTLTKDLSAKILDSGRKISLACIDCDLYESAVDVFNFIDPLLQQGSVIYLDDIFIGYKGNPTKGVAKAWLDFQAKSRFHFVQHLSIGWWGRSYIACTEAPATGTL